MDHKQYQIKPFSGFISTLLFVLISGLAQAAVETGAVQLQWSSLGELPDASGGPSQPANLGVAGPFVGVHNDALIIAGGANFPIAEGDSLWSEATGKVYYDRIWVASREGDGLRWHPGDLRLPGARAYGASASHALGVFAIGGRDAERGYPEVWLLRWHVERQQLDLLVLPPIPVSHASGEPGTSVNGGAAVIGDTLYVLVGEDGVGVSADIYSLDLSRLAIDEETRQLRITDGQGDAAIWQRLPSIPEHAGQSMARSHMVVVAQHDGRGQRLFVIGGRREVAARDYPDAIPVGLGAQRSYWHMFSDIWAYDPERQNWRYAGVIDVDGRPMGLSAGTGVALGQSHILLLSGANGDHLREAFGVRGVAWADYPDHPGFHRRALSFNTVTGRWAAYNEAPLVPDPLDGHPLAANAVTTPAVVWGEQIVLASGELRPRVRSPQIRSVEVTVPGVHFGWINMSVLMLYLLAVVLLGVWFMFRNKNTDDYFRGGQNIPWWAAACSIYATMLSSLTYVALPALVYRTDWLLFIGIAMILVVAPFAVYVVMPFFRQIDATSAYEYLSLRFNMPVRLFASGLFTLFHVSRMGVVMALTSLALAAVTPLEPWHCVLLMGMLCLAYSTLGGVEAVIWTDTLQTFVLWIGAVVCIAYLMAGIDGGFSAFLQQGLADGKFRMADLDFGRDSALTLSIWVIVLGGIGQNLSNYTADQAVVQRYMTTRDRRAAGHSIWANGLLAAPASLLFFVIGSGLYYYYQSHPEKLDPTKQFDQIFPSFIAAELPVGVAGLIVAGIFAAAQSTISTSMNSTASTLVTDFLRPFGVCRSERAYLSAARGLTLAMGLLGTTAGLFFISPEIRSLMEEYFKVIGMFMGALGGLFILGISTRRANGWGALAGLVCGVLTMILVWQMNWANGYLFAAIGIATCILTGYVASLILPEDPVDLSGLTLHTLKTHRGR